MLRRKIMITNEYKTKAILLDDGGLPLPEELNQESDNGWDLVCLIQRSPLLLVGVFTRVVYKEDLTKDT